MEPVEEVTGGQGFQATVIWILNKGLVYGYWILCRFFQEFYQTSCVRFSTHFHFLVLSSTQFGNICKKITFRSNIIFITVGTQL